MTDILEAILVEVPCPACGGRYKVSLAPIVLSQQMLHIGCNARGESECPPLAYADLVDEEVIEDLRRAWRRLEERAARVGGKVSLRVLP